MSRSLSLRTPANIPKRCTVSHLTMSSFYPPPYDANPSKPMLPSEAVTHGEYGQYAPARSSSPSLPETFRELSRTPSPTPSEEEALHPVPFDRSQLLTKEFWWNKAMMSASISHQSALHFLSPCVISSPTHHSHRQCGLWPHVHRVSPANRQRSPTCCQLDA